MNPLYPDVARRAEARCEYCRAPETVFNFSFEVEHIISASQGGTDALDNLALACRSCNVFKSFRQSATDPETGQRVPLFHPRHDLWDVHFAVNAETQELIGRTPTGRATVVTLQLNSEEQLQARTLWKQFALFP
jgi:hypothetical protein